MYKLISFGHRCSSASFIRLLNLKTESYPFDWLVSKLDVIEDCIKTKFVNFLNENNYQIEPTQTYNMIDNEKIHICDEVAHINNYYQNDNKNNSTYHYKLALNHHNIQNDKEYYIRCINRLYELFLSDIKKYYIYFNPIVGINEYEQIKDTILNEYDNFNKFILTQTNNIFGIYFILIKHTDNNIKSIKIKETSNYNIYIIYCNENFLDGGDPFMGEHELEKKEILLILENILT